MKFLTIQEWEKYDWLSHFKDAQVSTEVDFIIRRTGTLTKTNKSRSAEGTEQ
jgi:Spore germination B3/ GerAC like, C-terminal.